MAPLVFDAAFEGDPIACDILEEGGRYLGDMVTAAARTLGMTRAPFDVVMAGSVFKGSSPVLIDAMRTVIHRQCPQARTVMALYEPVVGALLLGCELDGAVSDTVYNMLENSLAEAERKFQVRLKAE